ncbi:MAG TPA: hypothetical protein VH374_13045 [Polyangia bacterium]|nr:hypothetical protein [Polyangia bacterium]
MRLSQLANGPWWMALALAELLGGAGFAACSASDGNTSKADDTGSVAASDGDPAPSCGDSSTVMIACNAPGPQTDEGFSR